MKELKIVCEGEILETISLEDLAMLEEACPKGTAVEAFVLQLLVAGIETQGRSEVSGVIAPCEITDAMLSKTQKKHNWTKEYAVQSLLQEMALDRAVCSHVCETPPASCVDIAFKPEMRKAINKLAVCNLSSFLAALLDALYADGSGLPIPEQMEDTAKVLEIMINAVDSQNTQKVVDALNPIYREGFEAETLCVSSKTYDRNLKHAESKGTPLDEYTDNLINNALDIVDETDLLIQRARRVEP